MTTQATKATLETLCEQIGYGWVMQIVSDLWREKDPIGALTVGPCAGLITKPVVADPAPKQVDAANSFDEAREVAFQEFRSERGRDANGESFSRGWHARDHQVASRDAEVLALRSEVAQLSQDRTVGVKLGELFRDNVDAGIAQLKQDILDIIDRSGNEGIYNWGAPLREIRERLSALKEQKP